MRGSISSERRFPHGRVQATPGLAWSPWSTKRSPRPQPSSCTATSTPETCCGGDELTGIVDWAFGSRGARGIDVALTRTSLALLDAVVSAERFLARYRTLVPDYRHHPTGRRLRQAVARIL